MPPSLGTDGYPRALGSARDVEAHPARENVEQELLRNDDLNIIIDANMKTNNNIISNTNINNVSNANMIKITNTKKQILRRMLSMIFIITLLLAEVVRTQTQHQ